MWVSVWGQEKLIYRRRCQDIFLPDRLFWRRDRASHNTKMMKRRRREGNVIGSLEMVLPQTWRLSNLCTIVDLWVGLGFHELSCAELGRSYLLEGQIGLEFLMQFWAYHDN